jgi:hypothetical protein
MSRIAIPKHEWDERLTQLVSSLDLYAPVENDFSCDYVKLDVETIPEITYNKPKPVTPLKNFFLPIKVECNEPKQWGLTCGPYRGTQL